MKTEMRCVEGVVLHRTSFREQDQICTLFTSEWGLIKLEVKGKGRGRKKQAFYACCSPLMRIEAIYKEGRGEIFSCEEVHLLHSYPSLRTQFSCLQAACELLQVIYRSQHMHKPAPLLYKLLLFYLEKLPCVLDVKAWIASFKLKVLKHDGLLCFPLGCSVCQQAAPSLLLQGGEFFCKDHGRGGVTLEAYEQSMAHCLTESVQMSQLSSLMLSEELSIKIDGFFCDSFGCSKIPVAY
jgi:DNA repair protein RecO (recombination protein O)